MSAALDSYIKSQRKNTLWEVNESSLGGRGVFAACNLPEGVEVYRERALVLGPRADPRCPVVCVCCFRADAGDLVPCSKGCGLLVCGPTCENNALHTECQVLSQMECLELEDRLPLVCPIRAIFLSSDEKEVLESLEGHENDKHDRLLNSLAAILTPGQMQIARTCCQVFDATAYEVPIGKGASVRGLYPIGALINHDCTPNSRHCFDPDGQMVLLTTRPIHAGEEITTTYTCLTWGTLARRMHLLKTKEFMCRCERCLDPTEFDSRLMGLYCMKKKCGGVILPCDSSILHWQCVDCATKIPPNRIAMIQTMICKKMADISTQDPKEGSQLLRKNAFVPSCNHYAVEFKLGMVRQLGHMRGYEWSELSNEEVRLKYILCQQLILLLQVLQLEKSSLIDSITTELKSTELELSQRSQGASSHYAM